MVKITVRIGLGIIVFLVVAGLLNTWSQTATYTDGPGLALGPQLKSTNETVRQSCVAMGFPSVFEYAGWPFPSLKSETPCDPVRIVYPVGILLNTVLAVAITAGMAFVMRGEKSNDSTDSQEHEEEPDDGEE